MAATDPFGGLPPELYSEYERIKQRNAIAQVLAQQGMRTQQAPRVKGRFEVPMSPFAPISQAVQGYLGGKLQEEGNAGMADLSKKYTEGMSKAVADYAKNPTYTQGSSEVIMDEQANQGEGATSLIYAPGRTNKEAIVRAMTSSYPQLRTLGGMDYQQAHEMNKLEEARKLDLQNKLAAIQEAAREGRITKSEADARHADLQKSLRQMMVDQSAQTSRDRNATMMAIAEMTNATRRDIADARREEGKRPVRGQIVDPKNPSQMLEVDLNTYKGGTVGDIGVFGVAGKEPTAAKRSEKEDQGKEQLRTLIDNMRTDLDTLNRARAIPSDSRGTLSNLGASLQSSAVGQMAGRAAGTKEQTSRNNIMSSRLQMMNAIRNATGMTSKQLDSNMELKTWLDSLTNLSGSYESNSEILNRIEQQFLGGAGAWEVVK